MGRTSKKIEPVAESPASSSEDEEIYEVDSIVGHRYQGKNRCLHFKIHWKGYSEATEVAAKTQVGNDSIIGEYTKIDERSSIKKSCVGAHCVIGKNVKIANSVIMDHVVIADNAKVDGCVICNNAKVLEKASLKDCDVAAQYVVEKESQVKGEKLVSFREAI